MMKEMSVVRPAYFRKRSRRTAWAAVFFLLPGAIIYLFFVGGPVFLSLILSFTKYDILHPVQWVGLDNFRNFFTNPRVPTILWNTVKYVIIFIPLHVVLGLILALIVDKQRGRLMTVMTRSSIYFPYLITTASAAAAWFFMFDSNHGVFNYFLYLLNLPSLRWLTDKNMVYISLAIYSSWKYVGESFLFYLVGLQTIPEDYSEAARIDGANVIQAFFHVKLPMLTPTIFYVLIIKTIHCFQLFEEPFLLTSGGPGDASRSIAVYLYDQAFVNFDFGYASVVALFLFAATMIMTLILFSSQKKWVCYDT